MTNAGAERIDILCDLSQSSIGWESLHHGLEALDQAGFIPHHFTALSDQLLATVDEQFLGAAGRRLAGAGAWLIARKTSADPAFICGEAASTPARPVDLSALAGLAGYGGRAASRLAGQVVDRETATAGPFILDGALAAHRLTLTHAALFRLRERGYRRAILADIRVGALPALRTYFGNAIQTVLPRPPRRRPRVVLCASGSGSNLQAVLDAVAANTLDFDVVHAFVNRIGAKALERAQQAGVGAELIPWRRALQSRAEYDEQLTQAILKTRPDLVLLLGWMHVLAPATIDRLPECINIHPAYLPLDPACDTVVFPDGTVQSALRGAHAVDDALAADYPWIGASVHNVTATVDRGEILARVPIPRLPAESRAALDGRLHETEHRLLIAALKTWHADRL